VDAQEGHVGTAIDSETAALLVAQHKADALFREVVDRGLIKAGVLESELTDSIHEIAQQRFGLKRHWHKRVVRSGPNTVLGYYDDPPDRAISEDDTVYLDFGPVFDQWEADYGRTYVVGQDPAKHRLVADIEAAFRDGKAHFENTPGLTAGGLYDYVFALAGKAGWEFGALTAGHLVGHFPHETAPAEDKRFSIRHGNTQDLREPDRRGRRRHWILEIHFVDRVRCFGGFFEQLLTT
jgi:Xaa-Pro dipeptidase